MQLPRVSFGPVQNDVAPATARVAGAVGGLAQTMEQGLAALGHEVVKTQTQDAALKLTQGLDDLVTKLKTQKAIPLDELKAELGPDFDKLDEGIRKQPLVHELVNGQPIEDPEYPGVPRMKPGDVPTFQVADLLYRRRAQKLLEDASTAITVGEGWRSSFQRSALADIIAKGASLDQEMLQQSGEFLASKTVDNALKAAYRGDFNLADAIAGGSAAALGAKSQAALVETITGLKQRKPIDDALLKYRTDPSSPLSKAALEDASKALGDDKVTGGMKPDDRAALANQVHAALEQANRGDAQRQAAGLALQIIRENTDPTGKINEGEAYKALNAHFAPTGKLAARPELWDDANRILNQGIAQKKTERAQALGDTAGQALDEFMAIGPDGQPHMSFLNVKQQTLAGLRTFGKDGEDVIAQLVRWDQANDMHERNRRQLPSPSEDARALAIERSLRRDPDTYRKMPTAELLAVLTGRSPVPGEPDAPAVAVSSRDLPKLRDILGANAATPPSVQVTSPETIASQEFERSFGLQSIPSKRWTPKQREAFTQVTDEVARWVNGERAAGRHPTDDQIRDHLTGQGGLLHKLDRKSILGVQYGPRTPLEQRIEGGAAPAPAGPPTQTAPGAAVPPPATRPRRAPAANSAQVPLELRQRIIDDFRAMYPGRTPTGADIVRGYNAGLAAGEF